MKILHVYVMMLLFKHQNSEMFPFFSAATKSGKTRSVVTSSCSLSNFSSCSLDQWPCQRHVSNASAVYSAIARDLSQSHTVARSIHGTLVDRNGSSTGTIIDESKYTSNISKIWNSESFKFVKFVKFFKSRKRFGKFVWIFRNFVSIFEDFERFEKFVLRDLKDLRDLRNLRNSVWEIWKIWEIWEIYNSNLKLAHIFRSSLGK